MLSITKVMQTTKVFLLPRLAASLQNANIATKTMEEKLGLPRRPRKPLSPYFRFLAEVRPRVSKENPKFGTLEIVQSCAKEWAVVDDNLRKKLTDEYMIEKEKYVKERASYEGKLTDDQKYDIQVAKQDLQESREKRAYKKKLREMDKPRKPASGFLRFLKEAYATSNKDNRGEFREFHKKIVQNWHEMSDEKKNVYNEASKAESVVYRQELAKWELKMVRLGNIDLVRQEALIEQENQPPRGKGRSKTSKSD